MGGRNPERYRTLVKDSSLLRDIAKAEQLWVACARCRHEQHKPLDLRGLIDHLGRSASISDLRQRLKCTQCNSRQVEFRTTYVGLRPGDRR